MPKIGTFNEDIVHWISSLLKVLLSHQIGATVVLVKEDGEQLMLSNLKYSKAIEVLGREVREAKEGHQPIVDVGEKLN